MGKSISAKDVCVWCKPLSGTLLLFSITEHCYAKYLLNILLSSLKSLANLSSWYSGGMHRIFLLLRNILSKDQ